MPKKAVSSFAAMYEKFNDTMGSGVIHTASKMPPCRKIKSVIPMYNYVTTGGFPIGRIIEHVGPNGSLKSYAGYDALAKFQHYDWANHVENAFASFECDGEGEIKEIKSYTLRKGYKPEREPEFRYCVLVDLESTYTPDWGKRLGIDNDALILFRPSSLSQAVDAMQIFLADPNISFVMLDSLSAIGTDDEMESSMESNQMASGARFWSRAFRKFLSAMIENPNKGESTLLYINSLYQKTGIPYGNPEMIRNGDQIARAKTLSVKFKALKEIQGKTDTGDIVTGHNLALECLKKYVGIGKRKGSFYYAYVDDGVVPAYTTDVNSQLIDLAMRFGLIERKGAWYIWGDLRVQGLDNFVTEVVSKGKLAEIECEIDAKISDTSL